MEERFRMMEELVLESREAQRQSEACAKSLEERMQEEIKRQVQLALSALKKGELEPAANISPPGQLKSSCASTELPAGQDDATQHFPVDDVTEPLTPCELHIPRGMPQSWWQLVL